MSFDKPYTTDIPVVFLFEGNAMELEYYYECIPTPGCPVSGVGVIRSKLYPSQTLESK